MKKLILALAASSIVFGGVAHAEWEKVTNPLGNSVYQWTLEGDTYEWVRYRPRKDNYRLQFDNGKYILGDFRTMQEIVQGNILTHPVVIEPEVNQDVLNELVEWYESDPTLWDSTDDATMVRYALYLRDLKVTEALIAAARTYR